MFTEIAASITTPFNKISIPSINDREIWEELNSDLKREIILQGERYLNYPYPQLLATEYMNFVRTGNRTDYENKFFDRRIALNALVLAECVENQGRFLDDIINGIVLICEEAAWQIPAHNSYVRDTPQLILPLITKPVIDLFAAETAAILGVTKSLLRPRLDEVTPLIQTMIEDNLNRRIFQPYLTQHFWWMGDGQSPMNNWTVWCTQNILLAAFTGSLPEHMQHAIFEKACKSADYFLDEYGEDGCCDEGAGYYRHAGLCLFNTIEILNDITGDMFLPLYKQTKIYNIAAYILNVHVNDIYYINFADCSPVAGRCNAREFLFGKRTGNPQLMAFAAKDYKCSEEPLLWKEHNPYYRLQAIFTHQEMLSYASGEPVSCQDCYYESAGLWIARDDTYCLAVKAGGNDDSHNHNDTGSFILYKNGLPLFIDAGVETYTKKTFSPQRYELWPMQSAYHNLLTFDSVMQKDGAEYCSKDVSVTFDDHFASISMELAAAYPDERIRSYRREVTFVKKDKITIKDTFESSCAPVVLSLMTYEKPIWHEANHQLQVGNLDKCLIIGAKSIKIEPIPITDERLALAWKHDIYRTLVTLDGGEILLRCTV